jgi:recombination protein RecT
MSGEVKDIRAYLVYEGEWAAHRFEMVAGDEEKIVHRPIIEGAPGEPERGAVIGGYAVAVLSDGRHVREWLPLSAIEKRRRSAPSQRVYEKGKLPRVSDEPLGVWRDWWEEQALKTLVRAISKKLPLSSDDMRAIMESDHDFEPSAPTREQVRAPSLEERLRAVQEPAQPPQEPEPPADEVEEAEVVDGGLYDPEAGSPMDPAYDEGVAAYKAGKGEDANPHVSNPALSSWIDGWRHARRAAE